jgi:hypothetical protein
MLSVSLDTAWNNGGMLRFQAGRPLGRAGNLFFMKRCVLGGLLLVHAAGCQPPSSSAPPAGIVSASAEAPGGSGPPPAPPPPISDQTSDHSERASKADEIAEHIDPGLAGDAAMAAVPPDAKAFLRVSGDLYKTFASITDGESANAAAPRIRELNAEMKALFPAFKRFMATAPKAQVELVFRQQMADQREAAGDRSPVALIDLAREPGNEEFRAAYIGHLIVLRDDGTSGTRRSAEQELAKLRQ